MNTCVCVCGAGTCPPVALLLTALRSVTHLLEGFYGNVLMTRFENIDESAGYGCSDTRPPGAGLD